MGVGVDGGATDKRLITRVKGDGASHHFDRYTRGG